MSEEPNVRFALLEHRQIELEKRTARLENLMIWLAGLLVVAIIMAGLARLGLVT